MSCGCRSGEQVFFNTEHTEHTEISMEKSYGEENKITERIINAAIRVHKALGPGLLEKVYEECLCHLMIKDGLRFERQKELPILFEDVYLDAGFRMDFVVEDKIILELKATEKLIPLHEAQLYTYLKISKLPLGLLLNFNTKLLKDGIRRIAM
jgi:GxxExxY protein